MQMNSQNECGWILIQMKVLLEMGGWVRVAAFRWWSRGTKWQGLTPSPCHEHWRGGGGGWRRVWGERRLIKFFLCLNLHIFNSNTMQFILWIMNFINISSGESVFSADSPVTTETSQSWFIDWFIKNHKERIEQLTARAEFSWNLGR